MLGTNVCACCADMRGVTGRLPSRNKRAHAARLTAPLLCRFRRFRGHARRDEVLKWVETEAEICGVFFFFFNGVLFESRVMLLAIAVELEVFHFLLLR